MNDHASNLSDFGHSNDQTLESLSEQFLLEHRLGVGDTIEEFASRFPESQDRILRDFPGILELEQEFKLDVNDSLRISNQIGKYHLEHQIGRGGMGVVFASTHPSLETELAIKVLSIGQISDKRVLQRFHAEARACAVMDHPNIVPVYDYGIADNLAFLVMRRINGPSLATIVSDVSMHKELTWNRISKIGIQASTALQYAHDQGIIHRDVKPANMLLDGDGKLWLTDFGLAKMRDEASAFRNIGDLTVTGELVGTARYMAPERFGGICTPVSDVYGVGLTLYELAAGCRVWSQVEGMSAISGRPLLPDVREINPHVPETLSQIIMKACAFRPEERYQTVAELSFVLSRFAHGAPQADRRKARNGARKRWLRKDALIVSGTVACLIAASSSYWAIVGLRNARKASAQENMAVLVKEIEKVNWGDQIVSAIDIEDRRDREALVRVGSELISNDEMLPLNQRETIKEQFLELMGEYVEHGIRREQIQHQERPVMLWGGMPALISQVGVSGLSEEQKQRGTLMLNSLMKLSAARELTAEQKLAYTTAIDKLHPLEGELGTTYKDDELEEFINDICRIRLPVYFEPPAYLLPPDER